MLLYFKNIKTYSRPYASNHFNHNICKWIPYKWSTLKNVPMPILKLWKFPLYLKIASIYWSYNWVHKWICHLGYPSYRNTCTNSKVFAIHVLLLTSSSGHSHIHKVWSCACGEHTQCNLIHIITIVCPYL